MEKVYCRFAFLPFCIFCIGQSLEFVLKSIFRLRVFWLSIFFVCASVRLFAVEFTLSYFEKSVYYPNSEIQIKARLHNNGNQAFFFRSADNRIFNLKVRVRSLENQALKEAADYAILKSSSKPYFYRDISLEPGEEYAFVFTLNRFVQIENSGMFILEAEYLTDLTAENAIASNRLYLNIRPALSERTAARPEYYERIDDETEQLLVLEQLQPDEVVSYTLRSLMQQFWNRYFLYLDMERLIRQSSYYQRRFVASSEAEQLRLIGNFRDALREGNVPEIASMADPPSSFEIIRTTYTPKEAQVLVAQNFERDGYEELVRYTYYLHKKENIWYIYRISTQLVQGN